jgi:hypothetical protein
MLLRPDEYDVIATPNLNGDYLSDAGAAQVGGLGLAPGANIGDRAAMFEAKGLHTKRNYEIQRIETFSDGVFAFAVTLLIVSLEVPHSFEELLMTMRGFFAFGISFLILISIWNEQHRFFRLYGMDDSRTIALNGFLLFIVLFYVYPLKFVFSLMFRIFFQAPESLQSSNESAIRSPTPVSP